MRAVKAKKILKILGRILLMILLLAVLLLVCTSVIYHVKLHKTEQALRDAGYDHPVSVGDHALNVYCCGNENGKHTIVALSGMFDGEMSIGWRQMTAEAEKENRFVFLDRAGYGLSGDTKQEMTVENVVNDYRTALKNAGIEAPYLLMGHSLGGLYATCWESQYPDEIEAVIFVDGSMCVAVPEEEQKADQKQYKLSAYLSAAMEKLGLMPFVIRSQYGQFLQCLPETEMQQALYMMCKTAGTDAVFSEILHEDQLFDDAWNAMVPNEIPKLYIAASLGYHTPEDFIRDGISARSLVNVWVVGAEYETASDEKIYADALKNMDEMRKEQYEPYIKKLGECTVQELAGHHVIFLDKPSECSRIIMDYLAALDAAS